MTMPDALPLLPSAAARAWALTAARRALAPLVWPLCVAGLVVAVAGCGGLGAAR